MGSGGGGGGGAEFCAGRLILKYSFQPQKQRTERGGGACQGHSHKGLGSDGLPAPMDSNAPEITSPHLYQVAMEAGQKAAGDNQLVCLPGSCK